MTGRPRHHLTDADDAPVVVLRWDSSDHWSFLAPLMAMGVLGAVALALQLTLPQLWSGFQFVGDGTGPYDFAMNGVVLASIMITISTLINAFGVKLMTRINSIGVFVELSAAVLLILALGWHVVRGPEVLFDTAGFGEGHDLGFFGVFLIGAMASGYVMYGSSTMLVYTTGQGVHGFTLDPTIGEFLLSHPRIITPRVGMYYSVNESNFGRWDRPMQVAVRGLKGDVPDVMKAKNSRYIGSLVADFHRNLIAGGIFLYPADSRNPGGKLRLLYEASPMAFIAEQAEGSATDGVNRILDIIPRNLHQRTPLVIGSREDVGFVADTLRQTAGMRASGPIVQPAL